MTVWVSYVIGKPCVCYSFLIDVSRYSFEHSSVVWFIKRLDLTWKHFCKIINRLFSDFSSPQLMFTLTLF